MVKGQNHITFGKEQSLKDGADWQLGCLDTSSKPNYVAYFFFESGSLISPETLIVDLSSVFFPGVGGYTVLV